MSDFPDPLVETGGWYIGLKHSAGGVLFLLEKLCVNIIVEHGQIPPLVFFPVLYPLFYTLGVHHGYYLIEHPCVVIQTCVSNQLGGGCGGAIQILPQ